jgi:hypothetical protein
MTAKLNRRRVGPILGSVLALTLLLAVMAPSSAQGGQGLGHPKVRWDLTQIRGAGTTTTALPGGTDMGLDSATGDTVAVTGSGIVKPDTGDVTGGGTFVHMHGGSVFAQGFYVVTGLVSWEQRGGTFPAPNDGVGHISQASAGILTLNIQAFADGGAPSGIPGVLIVNCHFPTTPEAGEEGIELDILTFHFEPAGGVTLFHVFR